ncbi:MAG TPA: preprotein translocase subunit SecE [Solirubrobacteraceae bacterium]|jgi:preprotein translocase subunit SecE|nr:preprotein translocase subunit SecE [Solirubrobacteraceae bacterium]
MARDRQRAKQRKARRAGQNPGPERTEPRRANIPGELDHASGEADEFDAALVSGAGGRPVDDEPAEPRDSARREVDRDEDEEDEELLDEEEAEEDAALEREAVAAGERHGRVAAGQRAEAAPTKSAPARFLAFLRASWAELQRVQWPDRKQVAQATAVVIGFVIIAGAYLGVADAIAQRVVDFII